MLVPCFGKPENWFVLFYQPPAHFYPFEFRMAVMYDIAHITASHLGRVTGQPLPEQPCHSKFVGSSVRILLVPTIRRKDTVSNHISQAEREKGIESTDNFLLMQDSAGCRQNYGSRNSTRWEISRVMDEHDNEIVSCILYPHTA